MLKNDVTLQQQESEITVETYHAFQHKFFSRKDFVFSNLKLKWWASDKGFHSKIKNYQYQESVYIVVKGKLQFLWGKYIFMQ